MSSIVSQMCLLASMDNAPPETHNIKKHKSEQLPWKFNSLF